MNKIQTKIVTAAVTALMLFSQTTEAICGDKPKKYKKHHKKENICEKQARSNAAKWERKSNSACNSYSAKYKPVILSGNAYIGSSDYKSVQTNALGIGLTFHPNPNIGITFNHYYSGPKLSTSSKITESIRDYIGVSGFTSGKSFISLGATAGYTFTDKGNNTVHFGPALRIGHTNRINLQAEFTMDLESNGKTYPSVGVKAVFPLLLGRR